MIRQFTEQRRLNAAFSHDLRTPLTILKGHTTMLLSFIPKGLVSQQEVLDELSTVRNNVERLEKYVSAMTNLYRLEDIEIEKENISHPLLTKEFLYSWFDGFKSFDVNKLKNRKMLIDTFDNSVVLYDDRIDFISISKITLKA